MKFRVLAAALALSFAVSTAHADTSLTAYDAARQALLAIWAELPLTTRNVTLTDGPAAGYGNYSVHDGQVFKTGEKINVYVEVLGYGWKDNGDGTQSELLDADLNLVDSTGAIRGSQPKFLSADIKSREKLLETQLTFSAVLTQFPVGDYQLQYVLHDLSTGKTAIFEVPITLIADTSSDDSSSSAAPDDSSSSPPAVESSASSSAQ